MKISIIIPAYNEEKNLQKLLPYLQANSSGYVKEIIVVDGGSSDNTLMISKNLGALALNSPQKGRAAQMNYGAKHASADVLYFLHADSYPPKNFDRLIIFSIQNRTVAGCFLLRFDDDHPLLKFYSLFTALRTPYVRFGDQSLFVRRDVFEGIGGFRENLIVMEDQEIIHRLKRKGGFKLIDEQVKTSAKKYRENGVIRLQFIFSVIYLFYYAGASQETLIHIYKNLIRTD
ncbi:MAG: TIGR04283 family arsenosugar biosynthesis glycosyltransferase [Balneolaceae bacterium]|nr:TIGR04283 family arsenosugar biosynthesis glycosyltransferase [Balneolaceae bacterium]